MGPMGPFEEALASGEAAWLSSRLASLLPSASSLPEDSRPADTVTLSPSAQEASAASTGIAQQGCELEPVSQVQGVWLRRLLPCSSLEQPFVSAWAPSSLLMAETHLQGLLKKSRF